MVLLGKGKGEGGRGRKGPKKEGKGKGRKGERERKQETFETLKKNKNEMRERCSDQLLAAGITPAMPCPTKAKIEKDKE